MGFGVDRVVVAVFVGTAWYEVDVEGSPMSTFVDSGSFAVGDVGVDIFLRLPRFLE